MNTKATLASIDHSCRQITTELADWRPGIAPVAVVMISLNEAHNMGAVLQNLVGWAQEVFLVDSYSQDDTIDIALCYGVHVVQRRFRGFGDQWSFALEHLPITAPWTMKLDPDERLSDPLKTEIIEVISNTDAEGFFVKIRLFFMEQSLPVRLRLLRLWRTGRASMSDVLVNEHIKVKGSVAELKHDIEHHDSPDLEHWLDKQNRYTTAEAIIAYNDLPLADTPRLLGTVFQRRMWVKQNFNRLPLRYVLLFLYHWLWQGAWRAGWVGYAWARLRSDVKRLREYKRREIEITGRLPVKRFYGPGKPDSRVQNFD
ncbi:glycosyltransferase family 2 protein [Methylococcus mesophilus]|uniref:glycosyltransferase family 2 protein n=1 Tax=Methylococcus mesophilus TaxID=2993564 RepID=UPI00224A58E6|nr:glycosyltransferase family 2 protein [Methylococcus mesophilus]UZR28744.1 glycosyltransferase family 2 protein [Methylococcus mesophilus]